MSKSAPDRKPGRPRTASSPDLELAILDAAIELFGDRGFDGVSLSQITGQAGADVGLIRYYFGSKADLWEASIGRLAELFGKEMTQAKMPEYGSKTDNLKAVIRTFVTASARWPQVSRIIVFDGNKTDARGQFIANRLVKPFYELLSKFIRDAKAEGNVPLVSDRTIFFMITHGGSFPMALPALTNEIPGGDINSVTGLTTHADAIIALICDG